VTAYALSLREWAVGLRHPQVAHDGVLRPPGLNPAAFLEWN
jgi:hypothetical protein